MLPVCLSIVNIVALSVIDIRKRFVFRFKSTSHPYEMFWKQQQQKPVFGFVQVTFYLACFTLLIYHSYTYFYLHHFKHFVITYENYVQTLIV